MSFEEEQWEEDRRNGTLDDPDPIYRDWKTPQCSCCSQLASLAVMPKLIAKGSLSFPPYEDAIFYCRDHYPEQYK